MYEEWQSKSIAFSTVSAGNFGGLQALTHLEFVFKKIGAFVDQANFSISKVQDRFDDFGIPTNKKKTDELAKIFIEEFIKFIKRNK